jgi:hypothetical protein
MTDPQDARARNRFVAIQLIRVFGVCLAVAGLMVLGGKIAIPKPAGLIMALVGILDATLAPLLLARRWKSPPQ